MSQSETWTENHAPAGPFELVPVTEVVRYRELAYFLALRDLQIRYKQTVFGVAWVVVQPLVGAAIFALTLGQATDLPSEGLPYLLFVYAGLMVWTYLSQSVTEAARSLVDNEALVSKIYFPRILAPLASVLPRLLDFALSLPLVALLMVLYDAPPDMALVLLPVWVACAVALAIGVGSLLAAINVKYRDVRQALPFLIQTWLFASPVFYPASLASGDWSWGYYLNPVAGLLEGFRWSLLDGPAPEAESLISLGTGLLMLAVGVLYFHRAEREFADVI